ncbi:hypothetical protein FBUS_06472 [Fasciolopsis buskii]|uniref:Uncharacterized protein n=1 Tax=Fasciolopsis buskii TaxID=27845 RepID=A0A8E0VQK5_9TREM|nr:hypothetical protein FBUS_06472 [Fasciolopsis buski]
MDHVWPSSRVGHGIFDARDVSRSYTVVVGETETVSLPKSDVNWPANTILRCTRCD